MRERKTKEPFYASVANPRRGLDCARPVLPRTKEYGLENGNEVVAHMCIRVCKLELQRVQNKVHCAPSMASKCIGRF